MTTLAESLRKEGKTMDAEQAQADAVRAKNMSEKITALLQDIKSKETDKNILQYVK
jgi:hypothetical protein